MNSICSAVLWRLWSWKGFMFLKRKNLVMRYPVIKIGNLSYVQL